MGLAGTLEAELAPLDIPHAYLYTGYGVDNTYEMMSGVFALPVAENPPDADAKDSSGNLLLPRWSPVVTVQAHAPFRVRNVRTAATKTGSPPLLAAPESDGSFVFLGGSIYMPSPSIDTNGKTHTWSGVTTYTFVENVRSDYNDGFILGAGPLPNFQLADLDRQFKAGDDPTLGAIAHAGEAVVIGAKEAANRVDFDNPGYYYSNTTFWPGQFFQTGYLNGSVEIVDSIETELTSGGSGLA